MDIWRESIFLQDIAIVVERSRWGQPANFAVINCSNTIWFLSLITTIVAKSSFCKAVAARIELRDLQQGKADTVGALLVAVPSELHFALNAATRLTQAGLEVLNDRLVSEPELTLYARLQAEQDDAYSYYKALLDRLNSFCNALEQQKTWLKLFHDHW